MISFDLDFEMLLVNRPFNYSKKEPGSSDVFIHYYTRGTRDGAEGGNPRGTKIVKVLTASEARKIFTDHTLYDWLKIRQKSRKA